MESTLRWRSGLTFDADQDGHSLVISDSDDDQGPRPKGLLLSALAGCAGIDVVSILKKMRQELRSFSIRASAEQTDDHPRVFVAPIEVVIDLEGDLDPAKVWRAVALSRDKYCGVAAMLGKHAEIRYVVRIDGVVVEEPAGPRPA